jgi:hypothetical protein
MNSRSELEGWGTWQEDRRYLSRDRAHMIVVSKRTQRYGTEEKVFWKNERRKLNVAERKDRGA